MQVLKRKYSAGLERIELAKVDLQKYNADLDLKFPVLRSKQAELSAIISNLRANQKEV